MENNSGIIVYTDGGCRGNPGCGGWGCVIIDGEKEYKFSGGEKLTTNNRMELMAAISALNSIAENALWKNQHISVYSDSQYVKNGITSWIQNWKKNGWKTSAKKPVLNKDLWVQLDSVYNLLDIFVHIDFSYSTSICISIFLYIVHISYMLLTIQ